MSLHNLPHTVPNTRVSPIRMAGNSETQRQLLSGDEQYQFATNEESVGNMESAQESWNSRGTP